jgi:hypothetical protein
LFFALALCLAFALPAGASGAAQDWLPRTAASPSALEVGSNRLGTPYFPASESTGFFTGEIIELLVASEVSPAPAASEVALLYSLDGVNFRPTSVPVFSAGAGVYGVSMSPAAPTWYRFSVHSGVQKGALSPAIQVSPQQGSLQWTPALDVGTNASRATAVYGESGVMAARIVGVTRLLADQVRVQYSSDGVTYVSRADGPYQFKAGEVRSWLTVTNAGYYRLVHAPKTGTSSNSNASEPVYYEPRSRLYSVSAPSKARANRKLTVTGLVYPRQASGSRTVRLLIERRKGKRWVKVRSCWAKNSNRYGFSRFSAGVKLKAGTYRFTPQSVRTSTLAPSVDVVRSRSVRVR